MSESSNRKRTTVYASLSNGYNIMENGEWRRQVGKPYRGKSGRRQYIRARRMAREAAAAKAN